MKRVLIGLAGAMALATGGAALAADTASDGHARVIHVYNTPDGESHVEVLTISDTAKALPVQTMTANPYKPSTPSWHNVPQPQFTINMTGTLEVEVSTGAKRTIGPGDLVFLEDAVGKGHITRVLTPVTNLFIRVPKDFSLTTWAKGG